MSNDLLLVVCGSVLASSGVALMALSQLPVNPPESEFIKCRRTCTDAFGKADVINGDNMVKCMKTCNAASQQVPIKSEIAGTTYD